MTLLPISARLPMDFIPVKELCRRLGITKRQALHAIRRHRIPIIKDGQRYLVAPASFRRVSFRKHA